MQDSKQCPYLTRTLADPPKPELLQEYYAQRTLFSASSADNSIRIGIPEVELEGSTLKPDIIRLSSAIPELLNSASRLQYFRLKLLEKIQSQEDLHEKCENISNEYSLETKQKLLALGETLKKRKILLQKVTQEKNKQKKIEEEIDNLNLNIQEEKNKLVYFKTKSLQNELNGGKVDMDMLINSLEEVRKKIEKLEKVDKKNSLEFEDKFREKRRVLEELEKKIKGLVVKKNEKLEENKEILDDIERIKLIHPETEGKIIIDAKSYKNYSEEIRELQGQIIEYKSLQQSYIADRHSLLEPLKYLQSQNIQKSHQSISNDLDQISNTSLLILKSLQDSLNSSSLQLSTSFKSFANTLQSASSKSNSTFKPLHKHLLNTFKSLLSSTQKSELLLKTLDAQDRALDSFKHENCSDI